MGSYRDMVVWQKSMILVKEVYQLVKFLPKKEMYALSSQIRRSVISIPSNIAEGYGRHSDKEFIHFLNYAKGSKFELETQLEICIMMQYFDASSADCAIHLCDEIGKMLNSLIRSLST